MATLRIDKLNKAYGDVQVLKDIELAISDGEFVVLVGPSGCGKSTLLRMIAGLDGVTSGDIHIGERRVTNLEPSQRKIAMVFQSYALYPHMNVRKNMTFGLKFTGVPPTERERRVTEAARMLRLEELLERYPRDLSGGQRQRVAIGRAIVREPSVFLFDEPLSNLDAGLRVNTRVEIAKLHRELAATMIYVTHDQVEAMTLASKIVVLNRGRIEQAGAPLDLYHRPQNLFVAGFIGSPRMNLIRARVIEAGAAAARLALADGGEARLPLAGNGLAPGAELTLGVRPEHMAVGDAGLLAVRGSVDAVERLGEASYIHMHLADGTIVTLRTPGDSPVEPGALLTASAGAGAVHVFDAAERAIAHIPAGG